MGKLPEKQMNYQVLAKHEPCSPTEPQEAIELCSERQPTTGRTTGRSGSKPACRRADPTLRSNQFRNPLTVSHESHRANEFTRHAKAVVEKLANQDGSQRGLEHASQVDIATTQSMGHNDQHL
jgi:hypothetical protein